MGPEGAREREDRALAAPEERPERTRAGLSKLHGADLLVAPDAF